MNYLEKLKNLKIFNLKSALSVFFDEFSPTPYQQFHSLGRPLIPLNNNNNNNNISFTNNGVNSLSV